MISGGAERVLNRLLKLLPNSDLFTLIYRPKIANFDRKDTKVFASWLSSLPKVERYYRWLAPFMPWAIESLPLKGYDLVVSSSWAFAHGALKGNLATQLAYIHSPMRWAWDLKADYLTQERLSDPLRWLAEHQLQRLRRWDHQAAQRPDCLIANSRFVAERIQNYWSRSADIIYPPVTPLPTVTVGECHNAFVSVSRLVNFKRLDFWLEVFRKLPEKRLIIVGEGPEKRRLMQHATRNVEFLGRVSDYEVSKLILGARAFLQASQEDFGISTIEAQSLGCPVIALARGGALETVNPWPNPNASGVLFKELDQESVAHIIRDFDNLGIRQDDCRANADRFSPTSFDRLFRNKLAGLGFTGFLPNPR